MCYAVGYATAVTLKLRLGCDSFRAYLYLGVLLWAQVTVGELVLRKTSMMFVPTMCKWYGLLGGIISCFQRKNRDEWQALNSQRR